MKDALEAVRVGEMSINQAAIHYNLPYSSLYGRFKRGKYEDGLPHQDFLQQEMTVEQFPTSDQQQSQGQTSVTQTSGQQSQPPQQPQPGQAVHQQPTPPPTTIHQHQQSLSGAGHAPEQY